MDKRIVLASASPRRRELLGKMGVRFDILVSDVDESFDGAPQDGVREIACRKARAVFSMAQDAVVIGADTLVVIDGCALGKPKDRADAKRMLQALSGREHDVYTGVCVIDSDGEQARVERTGVVFRPLTDEAIETYLDTDEPYDKAGAYAIQGLASAFIEGFNGSYENVVGFPVDTVAEMLANITTDKK